MRPPPGPPRPGPSALSWPRPPPTRRITKIIASLADHGALAFARDARSPAPGRSAGPGPGMMARPRRSRAARPSSRDQPATGREPGDEGTGRGPTGVPAGGPAGGVRAAPSHPVSALAGLREPIVMILLIIGFLTWSSGKPLDGALVLRVGVSLAWDTGRRSRQAVPAEAGPAKRGPVDTSPVDTSPVDTSPVDTSPVEASPVEASSAAADSAEAGAA